MNFDGSITISDVWLWIKWFYFYPGDVLVYLLLYKTPSVAGFFEMTFSSYGGVFSGIASFIFFIYVALIILNSLEDFSKPEPSPEEKAIIASLLETSNTAEDVARKKAEKKEDARTVKNIVKVSGAITLVLYLGLFMLRGIPLDEPLILVAGFFGSWLFLGLCIYPVVGIWVLTKRWFL